MLRSAVDGLERPAGAAPAPPRPALRLTERGRRDPRAAEDAAARFLAALGVDLSAEGVLDTPRRMAAAYCEMLTPRPFELTTFSNSESYDEIVLARGLPVQSVCEHHVLPFVGVAHVGYLPGDRIIGLSKLARVVELFARRLQVQERLTGQVAAWLDSELAPRGVAVVIEAEHLCMALRGARAPGSTTVTSAMRGRLRDDARSRAEFLELVGVSGGAR